MSAPASPAVILPLAPRRPERPESLHGELLGTLLRLAGLDAHGFARLLAARVPAYAHHPPHVVREWIDGRLPGSPYPLMVALEAAVRQAGELPVEVMDLLRG